MSFPATLKTHPRSHQHVYIYRSVMISANSDLVYPCLSIHTGGCLVAEVARVNHWVKLRWRQRFLQPRSLSASCCHREKSPPWWIRKTRHRHGLAWWTSWDVRPTSNSPETVRNSAKAIPSGNLLHSYWKWPLIVDFPIKNGDFP